jgi:VCBS repeat-containing protein
MTAGGRDGPSATSVHSLPHSSVPKDAVVVPDAHLLFHGDFKRSGVDLILSGDDREIVLHDYFKGEKRAALASPDGAHLTGDIVNALTGSVQVSQADGSASVAKVIGHVTKLVGTATAIRNGVSIILHQGDNVEKGDVVQSGSNSTLGVTFIDGTVFGLSSNARMVLNEMVYDPDGSNNSSLISLVAGTISFVAGQTAKHGDMKIDTPVATMGIRGTAVLVEIDFTVPGQGGQPDAKFQVLVEPDGTTGSYILFDKTTLQPLAVVNQAGQQINISQGVITQTNAPLSPDVQKLINDVFTLKFTDNTNPKTDTGHNNSITPQTGPVLKADNGTTATPIFKTATLDAGSNPTSNSNGPINGPVRIPGPPEARVLDLADHLTTDFSIAERAGITGDANNLDSISGKVTFTDPNAGDTPSVQVNFSDFAYHNAQHQDVTAKLSLLQHASIAKTEVGISVVPAPGNNNNGSASFTYSVPDKTFDFLAAGETLTLTYVARVDNNFAPLNETRLIQFTITVTGTNDKPVIAATGGAIT